MSVMLLATINMQSVLGYSAVISGLTALPLSITLAALAPFAGRLADRIGSKPILISGYTVYATGMFVLILALSVNATPFSFLLPYALMGLGMGCLLLLCAISCALLLKPRAVAAPAVPQRGPVGAEAGTCSPS